MSAKGWYLGYMMKPEADLFAEEDHEICSKARNKKNYILTQKFDPKMKNEFHRTETLQERIK